MITVAPKNGKPDMLLHKLQQQALREIVLQSFYKNKKDN